MEKIVIGKSNKHFEGIKSIIDCIPKDATRYSLNYLYVTTDRIAGTDGKVLAVMDNYNQEMFKPGYYEVLKNTKTLIMLLPVEDREDLRYPNIEDILPDIPENQIKEKPYISTEYREDKEILLAVWLYKIYNSGICIKPVYLKRFLFCDKWAVTGNTVNVLGDNGFKAVIMSIRVN